MLTIDKTYFGCFGELHRRKRTELIVVHHTCTETPNRTRKTLIKKGYSTHFEVDRDGTIYQYAPMDRKCIQCGSLNCATISVDVTHPKDGEWPDVQIEALYELLAWIGAQYEIPLEIHEVVPAGVYWHRAIGNTTCPQDLPIREDLCRKFAAQYAEKDSAT